MIGSAEAVAVASLLASVVLTLTQALARESIGELKRRVGDLERERAALVVTTAAHAATLEHITDTLAEIRSDVKRLVERSPRESRHE